MFRTPTLPGRTVSLCRQSSLLLLFVTLICSGCVTARKMDKWIDIHYAGKPPAKAKDQQHFSVRTPDFNSTEPASQTQKLKGSFIPALFYWQWNLTMNTQLNPGIGFSDLRAALLAHANAKAVKNALDGGSLELDIQKVPASFGLRDKGFMVFVLVAYFGSERVWFEPGTGDVQIKYR